MSDKETLDFIEARGIQIWPQRAAKHGPVRTWWVQNPEPFLQVYDATLRGALKQLKAALDRRRA